MLARRGAAKAEQSGAIARATEAAIKNYEQVAPKQCGKVGTKWRQLRGDPCKKTISNTADCRRLQE